MKVTGAQHQSFAMQVHHDHLNLGTPPAKSTGEPVIFGRLTRRDLSPPLCGDFDLHLHLGSCETNDDQQRRRGANVAEDFATDGEVRIDVLGVSDVVGRADNIGHREAALFKGGLDGPEAVS